MLAPIKKNVTPLNKNQIADLFENARAQFGRDIVPQDIIGQVMDADEFEYGRCYEDFGVKELWDLHGSNNIAIDSLPAGYTIENKRWLVQLASLVGYEYIMDVLRAIEKAYEVEDAKYELVQKSFEDSIR